MTWGQRGSATEHKRYMQAIKTRSKCWCGCGRRATHSCFANGVCLSSPVCELVARRWVKTGEMPRIETSHGCKRSGGFVDTGCTAPCDCHVTERLAYPVIATEGE